MIRTYSELMSLNTFEERFYYLQISSKVGVDTFGFDRIFNQKFYTSGDWLYVRNKVIARDLGYDLAVINDWYKIGGIIVVHHMNPILIGDIKNCTDILLNPEYLISTSDATHKAIHYGDDSILSKFRGPAERTRNDTCPWRH